MMACERKCEGGGGVLPVARSAVPAGTRARLLLTYTRLVMGGRLRARRWELWPERKVGTGRNARVLEAGYPAQLDLEGRITRASELELAEGLREPVVSGEPDERTRRRQGRAMASHDAGVAVARGGFAAGRVGTCSRRVVLEPEQAEQLELDDGEVQESPLRQQRVRADGGGEAESDGQELRSSGVEE